MSHNSPVISQVLFLNNTLDPKDVSGFGQYLVLGEKWRLCYFVDLLTLGGIYRQSGMEARKRKRLFSGVKQMSPVKARGPCVDEQQT
jgi:hypothetical protein